MAAGERGAGGGGGGSAPLPAGMKVLPPCSRLLRDPVCACRTRAARLQ